MGQSTLGILLGVKVPDGLDPEWGSRVVDVWDKANGISWRSPQPKVISEFTENGDALIGIWIAVSASGKNGVPYLGDKALQLNRLADSYLDTLEAAAELWVKFATHVKQLDGVELMPNQQLWLVPTEVA